MISITFNDFYAVKMWLTYTRGALTNVFNDSTQRVIG